MKLHLRGVITVNTLYLVYIAMDARQRVKKAQRVASILISSSKRVFALGLVGTVFILIILGSSKRFTSEWDFTIVHQVFSSRGSPNPDNPVTEFPAIPTLAWESSTSQNQNITNVGFKGKYESYFNSEPLEIHCNTCAYVSSSGHMLHSKLGEEIDSHECVFRSNDSPTTGFEADVGTKTTVRTLGLRSLKFVIKRLQEEKQLFDKYFFNEIIVGYFWYLPQSMKEFFRKYSHLKLYRFAPQQMKNIGEKFRTELKEDAKRHIWISSGFYSLILASDICGVVHIYGMPNADYCQRLADKDPATKAVGYHYYENIGDECKIYARHDKSTDSTHRFTKEKKVFEYWARNGSNLHFHNPEWPASGR